MVTGAGRGLGRALAVELAAAGFDLALLARSADELGDAAAAVEASGQRALPLALDLATSGAAETAVRATAGLGPVSLLVNNAATLGPVEPSPGLDPGVWSRALALNAGAAAALSFALLPAMIERGRGEIVNVSSRLVADPTAMPRGNAYVTSKAALEAHSVNLAAELAGSGVAVNVLRPGILDTGQQSWLREQGAEGIGAYLHARYRGFAEQGKLTDPALVARFLLERLGGTETGQVWDYEAG